MFCRALFLLALWTLTLVAARTHREYLTSDAPSYEDGRPLDATSEVARLVGRNPNQYWTQLLNTWRGHVRAESERAFHHWNETVRQDDQLLGRVSQQCLGVLQHIIQHPMEQEWSAKSEFHLPPNLRSNA